MEGEVARRRRLSIKSEEKALASVALFIRGHTALDVMTKLGLSLRSALRLQRQVRALLAQAQRVSPQEARAFSVAVLRNVQKDTWERLKATKGARDYASLMSVIVRAEETIARLHGLLAQGQEPVPEVHIKVYDFKDTLPSVVEGEVRALPEDGVTRVVAQASESLSAIEGAVGDGAGR